VIAYAAQIGAYKQQRKESSTMGHVISTVVQRLLSFALFAVGIVAVAVAVSALLLIVNAALI